MAIDLYADGSSNGDGILGRRMMSGRGARGARSARGIDARRARSPASHTTRARARSLLRRCCWRRSRKLSDLGRAKAPMYERSRGGCAGASAGSPSLSTRFGNSSLIDSSRARSRPAGSLAGRWERPERRPERPPASRGSGQPSAEPAAATGGLSWDGSPEEGEAVASPVP